MNNNIYFQKYIKYKTKYINLLKKYNQVGGNNIDKLDELIEMYKKIPETGLYDKNISLQKFIKYCKFVISKTKDDPEVLDLKRKIDLEKKKMQKTDEYKKLVKKISATGKKYQKLGQDFEKKIFDRLLKHVSKVKNIPIGELKLLKNPSLYIIDIESDDSESWKLIGEIDAIVMKGIEIVAICEIKKSFDDIPDAFFQIKRSYKVLKERGNLQMKIVTSNNKDLIIDSNYDLPDSVIDVSFIFTSEPENILNIQSKIKFNLINKLHMNTKINYKKLFQKILNKKNSFDKLKGKTILRYNIGVLETLDLFKKNSRQIQII
jgi:hypothetical protein